MDHASLVARATEALCSEDVLLRRQAVELLSALGATSARAAPLLISILSGEDAELRVAAAEALGRIGERAACEPLRAQLGSEDWELASASACALYEMGVPGVEHPEGGDPSLRETPEAEWIGGLSAIVDIARALGEGVLDIRWDVRLR